MVERAVNCRRLTFEFDNFKFVKTSAKVIGNYRKNGNKILL